MPPLCSHAGLSDAGSPSCGGCVAASPRRCIAAAPPDPLCSLARAPGDVPDQQQFVLSSSARLSVASFRMLARCTGLQTACETHRCDCGVWTVYMPWTVAMAARVLHTTVQRLTPGTRGGGSPLPPVCTMGPNRGRVGLKASPGGARCGLGPIAVSGRRRLRPPGEPPVHGMDKHRSASTGLSPDNVKSHMHARVP